MILIGASNFKFAEEIFFSLTILPIVSANTCHSVILMASESLRAWWFLQQVK